MHLQVDKQLKRYVYLKWQGNLYYVNIKKQIPTFILSNGLGIAKHSSCGAHTADACTRILEGLVIYTVRTDREEGG